MTSRTRRKLTHALTLVAALLIGAVVGNSCGSARASAGAQQISGPAGYTCFAIYDGDRVAGGNCVRN
jgi:hypothetical protein